MQTSAFSLKALAVGLLPSMGDGGAIVSLDFDATVAWPIYDWMGVAKAGLESVTRYLARDLGPKGIRVNAVSAGPIETMAGKGIPGFDRDQRLVEPSRAASVGTWRTRPRWGTPLRSSSSDLSSGITGEVVHVDGGFHAMGTDLV